MGPLFQQPIERDALAGSLIRASHTERRIFDLVKIHRGHKNAISIAALKSITGLAERSIKGAIAELVVTHRILIGGNRSDPVGYFMVEDAEDAELAAAPIRGQAIQMLRRLRVLQTPARIREFLGQQLAELEGDPTR